MEGKHTHSWISLLLVTAILVSLLSGCAGKQAAKEDRDTITVYLWSTAL